MDVDICGEQSNSETLLKLTEHQMELLGRKENEKNQRRFFPFLRRRVFGDIDSSATLPIGCKLADYTITSPGNKKRN